MKLNEERIYDVTYANLNRLILNMAFNMQQLLALFATYFD